MAEQLLSVVITPGRAPGIEKLDLCLMSLAGQRYQPLQIVIAVFKQSRDRHGRVDELVAAQTWSARPQVDIVVCDNDVESARKIGAATATREFIAFLSYEDIAFEAGYAAAVQAITANGSAWAMGTLRIVQQHDQHGMGYVVNKSSVTPEALGIGSSAAVLGGTTYPIQGCVFRRHLLHSCASLSDPDVQNCYARAGEFACITETICQIPGDPRQLAAAKP